MDADEYDALPQEVKDILDTHNGDEGYIQCQRIVDELNVIGWTCDYDLGSGIFGVEPLTKDVV